jgi:hypothetical protein
MSPATFQKFMFDVQAITTSGTIDVLSQQHILTWWCVCKNIWSYGGSFYLSIKSRWSQIFLSDPPNQSIQSHQG